MVDRPNADQPMGTPREGSPTGEVHAPSPAERAAQKKRNVAIALAVVGFVILVYMTTFFRLSQNLQVPPS
ncbi:MAG: protoheme IX farnesyltransferase [Pseudomonadota bacterium]